MTSTKHWCPGTNKSKTLLKSWGPAFMLSYGYVAFHYGRNWWAAWLFNDKGPWCKHK